jgi:hypothetical protein
MYNRHCCESRENKVFILRGVAQLVARLVWDQDAGGSSPLTSTKFLGGFTPYFYVCCTYWLFDPKLPENNTIQK